jgi:hypothetical protein
LAPDVTIHGPKGCVDIYEATKSFIVMHDFNVLFNEDGDDDFEDNAVTVEHVTLESSGPPVIAPDPLYTFWKPGKSTVA